MNKDKIGFDIHDIPRDYSLSKEEYMKKWRESYGIDENGEKIEKEKKESK